MKMLRIMLLGAALAVSATASAQYWELANQAAQMATTAVRGGLNYRGYVDVAFSAGMGDKRADIFELSTTQGLKVSKNFFIGLGLGMQTLFTSVPDEAPEYSLIYGHGTTKTGIAVPIFSDFRLDCGDPTGLGFFADLKIGASFMTGNRWILVGDGYINSSQCFYLRPTVGMRVPLSASNPDLAFTVGVTYTLLTSGTWYMNNNSVTLNGLGVNVGFEW